MDKKNAPKGEQTYIETTGLRIPIHLNDRIREKAKTLGISQNAMYMILLDSGLKVLDSVIIRHSEE